jgi:hypothetical protein
MNEPDNFSEKNLFSDCSERTSPDFKTWAKYVVNSHFEENVERALKEAFDQGYQLGVTKGWAIEQDKDDITLKKLEALAARTFMGTFK